MYILTLTEKKMVNVWLIFSTFSHSFLLEAFISLKHISFDKKRPFDQKRPKGNEGNT